MKVLFEVVFLIFGIGIYDVVSFNTSGTSFLSRGLRALPAPSCPVCDEERCPKTASECSHGIISDDCRCCKAGVCLLHEKEKCMDLKFSDNIEDSGLKKFSVCGENMECALKKDLKAGEIPESVCLCQREEICCGKNNVTYKSICQLKEAGTELRHAGACSTPPGILFEPEIYSPLINEKFSLNCEAKGYPVPNIHWEFEGFNGLFKNLPGDDPTISVHIRGGPEPLTIISWLMIESLRESDDGTYICVAKNSEGVARSGATVHVIKKNT